MTSRDAIAKSASVVWRAAAKGEASNAIEPASGSELIAPQRISPPTDFASAKSQRGGTRSQVWVPQTYGWKSKRWGTHVQICSANLWVREPAL